MPRDADLIRAKSVNGRLERQVRHWRRALLLGEHRRRRGRGVSQAVREHGVGHVGQGSALAGLQQALDDGPNRRRQRVQQRRQNVLQLSKRRCKFRKSSLSGWHKDMHRGRRAQRRLRWELHSRACRELTAGLVVTLQPLLTGVEA